MNYELQKKIRYQLGTFLGHYVIKIDNLIHKQLLAEAFMWHYISICMIEVKEGITRKQNHRMQVSHFSMLFFWEHFGQ